MGAFAFVFPGQGSQAVGMGQDLAAAFAAARMAFEEVDDALGERLSRLIAEGPESDLQLTRNTQPALLAASMAVVRALEGELGRPFGQAATCVAGHSLGEYTALTAVAALSLGDAARLLRQRGDAMQQAVPADAGAMAAILGLDLAAVENLAADAARAAGAGLVCEVANDNTPDQIVVSGDRLAVEQAIVLAGERGARRAVPLPVSAPFHCRLMAPAAEVMDAALAAVALSPLAAPLIANVTAQAVTQPSLVRDLLVRQVTGRVRWRESVAALRAAGVDTVVELGPGRVLSGLVRRCDRDLTVASAADPASLDGVLKLLG
ncbi:MAG: ACP S-malonyltransferase [Alphaproteobacteria bacterium]